MKLGARPIYVSMVAGVAFITVYIATIIGVRSLTGYDSYWAKAIVMPMITPGQIFTQQIAPLIFEQPIWDQPYFMEIELIVILSSLWLFATLVVYILLIIGRALKTKYLR